MHSICLFLYLYRYMYEVYVVGPRCSYHTQTHTELTHPVRISLAGSIEVAVELVAALLCLPESQIFHLRV